MPCYALLMFCRCFGSQRLCPSPDRRTAALRRKTWINNVWGLSKAGTSIGSFARVWWGVRWSFSISSALSSLAAAHFTLAAVVNGVTVSQLYFKL
ncbi:hypothetical protein B0H67DRAFT_561324 [Lasiosphaeris hirsuta]|uniref:Uncharacterized protein n=1 Tax=Lasiosphaeris hirsuta TaxID=260670 RepID=A0AA40E7Z9_9PEZI|nr:hypothetical protein B0H67DRAFT_561324 [Lasiosphaeris hirsuta]